MLRAMTSGAAATVNIPAWVVRSALAAVGTTITVAAGAVWYAVTTREAAISSTLSDQAEQLKEVKDLLTAGISDVRSEVLAGISDVKSSTTQLRGDIQQSTAEVNAWSRTFSTRIDTATLYAADKAVRSHGLEGNRGASQEGSAAGFQLLASLPPWTCTAHPVVARQKGAYAEGVLRFRCTPPG